MAQSSATYTVGPAQRYPGQARTMAQSYRQGNSKSSAKPPTGSQPQQSMGASAINSHHVPPSFQISPISVEKGPAPDMHDCTHEEQIDEFAMVDQEEVFDECDEQTGIQRHQMNVGLTRHPKNPGTAEMMFSVFNRHSDGNTHQIVSREQHAPSENSNSKVPTHHHAHMASAQQKQPDSVRKSPNKSGHNALQDQRDYNDFLRSSSPQMAAQSREGSRSPPPLAHFQKEAFFGSSFAANGIAQMAQQVSAAQSMGTAAGASGNPPGTFKKNTFALSQVNRQRDSQVRGRDSQLSAVGVGAQDAQDKGPQNFRGIRVGQLDIPDQFRNDLQKLSKQKANTEFPSQPSDEDGEERSSTFDLSHSLPYYAAAQNHEHLYQRASPCEPNEPNPLLQVIHTDDQDTIIDQDDDVAEECIAEDFQPHAGNAADLSLSSVPQQTVTNDGPTHLPMSRRTPARQDCAVLASGDDSEVQDETAVVEDEFAGHSKDDGQVQQSQHQIGAQWAQPGKKFGTQSSFAALSNFRGEGTQAAPRMLSTPGSQSYLLQSQPSTVSQLPPFNLKRGPLANKPRTNILMGPKQAAAQAGRPHLLTQQQQAFSTLSHGRSLSSRLSKGSLLQQHNPSIQDQQWPSQAPEKSNAEVCETVEDIQESVVFMNHRNGSHHLTPAAQNDTPQLIDKYAKKAATYQVQQKELSLQKNDNKDSKKLPGDLSLHELETTSQNGVQVLRKGSTLDAVVLSASQPQFTTGMPVSGAATEARKHEIDFIQGTFRSPNAAIAGASSTGKFTTSLTAAKQAVQVSALDESSSLQKSHAELQLEFMQVQRKLQAMKQTQQAQQQAASRQFFEDDTSARADADRVRRLQGKLPTNKNERVTNDLSGTALGGQKIIQTSQLASSMLLQEPLMTGSNQRKFARNVVSTRLTPKSQYGGTVGNTSAGQRQAFGAARMRALEQSGAASERADSSYQRRGGPQHHRSANRSIKGETNSQLRQIRMSARPYHKGSGRPANNSVVGVEGLRTQTGAFKDTAYHQMLMSPQSHRSAKLSSTQFKAQLAQSQAQQSQARKSPVPAISRSAKRNKPQEQTDNFEQQSDSMSAKNNNFSMVKQSEARLRNARTFVEEGTAYPSGVPQQLRIKPSVGQGTNLKQAKNTGGHKAQYSRSILSQQEKMSVGTVDDLGSQSQYLALENGKIRNRRPLGHAQLQALAELRQRENQTEQAGNLILGRQRSREANLDLNRRNGKGSRGALLKSTQDRLINVSGGPSATPGSLPTAEEIRRHKNMVQQQRQASVSPGPLPEDTLEESKALLYANQHDDAEYPHHDESPQEDILSRSSDPAQSSYSREEGESYDQEGVEAAYGDEEGDYMSRSEHEYGSDYQGNHSEEGGINSGEEGDYDEAQSQGEEHQPCGSESLEGSFEGGYSGEQDDGYDPDSANQQIRRRRQPGLVAPRNGQQLKEESSDSDKEGSDEYYQESRQQQQRVTYDRTSADRMQRAANGSQRHRKRHQADRSLAKKQPTVHQPSHTRHLSARNNKSPAAASQLHQNQQQYSGAKRDRQTVHKEKRAQPGQKRPRERNNQPLKIAINMTGTGVTSAGSHQQMNQMHLPHEPHYPIGGHPHHPQMLQGHPNQHNFSHQQQQYLVGPPQGRQNQLTGHHQTQQQSMYGGYQTPSQPHQNNYMFYPPAPGQATGQATPTRPSQLDAHHHQQYSLMQQPPQQHTQATSNQSLIAPAPHAYQETQPINRQSSQVFTELRAVERRGTDLGAEIVAAQYHSREQQPIDQHQHTEPQQRVVVIEGARDPSPAATQENQDLEATQGVSWLRQTEEKTNNDREGESAKEDGEVDEMDLIWKRLREHDSSATMRRESRKSQVGVDTKTQEDEAVVAEADVREANAQEEAGQEPSQEQPCEVQWQQRPKKAEALLIGFEDEDQLALAAKNHFAKKPVLRSKRPKEAQSTPQEAQPATQKQPQALPDEASSPQEEPRGADLKPTSLDVERQREQRRKLIKDQGLIEIAINDGQAPETNQNLADAFAAKRRLKQQQATSGKAEILDQDLAVATDEQAEAKQPASKPPKAEKVRKTPQELAEIRKAMLRKRHTPSTRDQPIEKLDMASGVLNPKASQTNLKSSQLITDPPATTTEQSQRPSATGPRQTRTPNQKEPNPALMERLAGGKRTVIDKKEMKKLTRINYENLPEIKRRKDEERKKQEALEKKQRIAQYNKECNARARAQLKKKREQAAAIVGEKPPVPK